jgi:hypothetical protein
MHVHQEQEPWISTILHTVQGGGSSINKCILICFGPIDDQKSEAQEAATTIR